MNSDSVQERAVQLFVKLRTTPDIDSHWSDFVAWLDTDSDHHKVYSRVQSVWADTEFLKEIIRAGDDRSPQALVRATTRQLKQRRVDAFIRIASIAILVGGMVTLFLDAVQTPDDEYIGFTYNIGASSHNSTGLNHFERLSYRRQ